MGPADRASRTHQAAPALGGRARSAIAGRPAERRRRIGRLPGTRRRTRPALRLVPRASCARRPGDDWLWRPGQDPPRQAPGCAALVRGLEGPGETKASARRPRHHRESTDGSGLRDGGEGAGPRRSNGRHFRAGWPQAWPDTHLTATEPTRVDSGASPRAGLKDRRGPRRTAVRHKPRAAPLRAPVRAACTLDEGKRSPCLTLAERAGAHRGHRRPRLARPARHGSRQYALLRELHLDGRGRHVADGDQGPRAVSVAARVRRSGAATPGGHRTGGVRQGAVGVVELPVDADRSMPGVRLF